MANFYISQAFNPEWANYHIKTTNFSRTINSALAQYHAIFGDVDPTSSILEILPNESDELLHRNTKNCKYMSDMVEFVERSAEQSKVNTFVDDLLKDERMKPMYVD